MAPAASVKVGEMSSKSRLQKIIKRDMQIYQKKKFRILQQSHQNSIIFSATKQRERERKKKYSRSLPRGSWMEDPEGRQSSRLGRSKSNSNSELEELSFSISLLLLFISDSLSFQSLRNDRHQQSSFGFGFFLIYIFLWGFLFSRLYSFRIVQ